MERDEVVGRVTSLLAREFEVEDSSIVPDADIYMDLGLDSLDAIDLIAGLEAEFGVRVDRQSDEESIRAIRTLTDVCDFITSKLT